MPVSPLLEFSKAQYERQSGLADKLKAYQFGQEIGRKEVERKTAERKLTQELNIKLGLLRSTAQGSEGRISLLEDIGRAHNVDVSGVVSNQNNIRDDLESYAKVIDNETDPTIVQAAYERFMVKHPGVSVPAPKEKKVDVTVGGQKFKVSPKDALASATALEGARIKKGKAGVGGVSKDQYNAAIKFMKYNINAYLPGTSIEDISSMSMSSLDAALGKMPPGIRDDMKKAYFTARDYIDTGYRAAGGGTVQSGDADIIARAKAAGERLAKTIKTPEQKKKIKATLDKNEIDRLSSVKRSATEELKMQALKSSKQLNKQTVDQLAESNPRGLLQLIKPKITPEAYRKLVRELALPPETVIKAPPALNARQQRASYYKNRSKNTSTLVDKKPKSAGLRLTGAKI